LQAAHAIYKQNGFRLNAGVPFLKLMQLDGGERKNLVPVDWVAGVIAEIIRRPELHGKTYHLTNPRPAPAVEIEAALGEALMTCAEAKAAATAETFAPTAADEQLFRDQTATYRSYFRDDPRFDDLHVRQAFPHRPCPVVDRLFMLRLARWAIDAGFGWPKPRIAAPAFDAEPVVRGWGAANESTVAESRSARRVGLVITGPGGGNWTVTLHADRILAVAAGLVGDAGLNLRLTTTTMSELAAGRLDCGEAYAAGRITCEGPRCPANDAAEAAWLALLERLFPAAASEAVDTLPLVRPEVRERAV
jgi:hypothetical protein